MSGGVPVVRSCGEAALLLDWASLPVEEANRRARWVAKRLEDQGLPGIREVVPALSSVWLEFDPDRVAEERLRRVLAELCRAAGDEDVPPGPVHEVPVVFGGAGGPDLAQVAAGVGWSEAELVRRLTGVEYRVLFLGFAPGFPYLGFSPAGLAVPRLAVPRPRVPAGSVALAGGLAGIYPREGPGGWRIVGRTSLRLFDPTRERPSLLRPDDRVRLREAGS